jgi:hypothetical protein
MNNTETLLFREIQVNALLIVENCQDIMTNLGKEDLKILKEDLFKHVENLEHIMRQIDPKLCGEDEKTGDGERKKGLEVEATRVAVLEDAIRWALGEHDHDGFRERCDNEGPYWWRKELRERAGKLGTIVKEARVSKSDTPFVNARTHRNSLPKLFPSAEIILADDARQLERSRDKWREAAEYLLAMVDSSTIASGPIAGIYNAKHLINDLQKQEPKK